MHNTIKKVLPEKIVKLFPKDAEEALVTASKETQEERNKIVEKNLGKISEFLYSEDAVPTRIQILSKNKKRIERLVETAYKGKKPSFGIAMYDGKYDYPLETALIIIKSYTNSIIKELEERDIAPEEIEKESGWQSKREKGRWTRGEIESLPLDWVKSAIVTYYTESEENGKDDSCSEKDGVINASELKECKKIIELGSVEKYLDSLNS